MKKSKLPLDLKVLGLFAVWLSLTRPLPRWREQAIGWDVVIKVPLETVCQVPVEAFRMEYSGWGSIDHFYKTIADDEARQNPPRVPLPAGVRPNWL